MKIAYLSTFYPFRGGIAQFNASLYRELEKYHDIRAFTFTRQYPHLLFPGATQYVAPADKVDEIPAQPILDSINPFSYRKAAALMRAYAPHLVLTKFWMPFFAPSLGYVAGKLRRRGATAIAIIDNLIPHEQRPGDMLLVRYFLQRYDGFVVMSKTVERDLLQLQPEARYTFKPHPLYDHFGATLPTDEARQKLGLPRDKKIILFFGFIRAYKGLDNLIRATAFLPDDYCVVIAGEMYGDFASYQTLIDETQTANRIKLFVRYIDDAEVPAFFSAADVCVLPYISATQSGIVQIAFNFNLPVIVTDVGGLAEMVENGETGLVVDSPTPQELATKIRFYFENKLEQNMRQAIAQKRGYFSWGGFAEAVMELYGKVRSSSSI